MNCLIFAKARRFSKTACSCRQVIHLIRYEIVDSIFSLCDFNCYLQEKLQKLPHPHQNVVGVDRVRRF